LGNRQSRRFELGRALHGTDEGAQHLSDTDAPLQHRVDIGARREAHPLGQQVRLEFFQRSLGDL
jgi:hypothetical protein